MSEPASLADWLEKLEQMQPDRIELGLSRISSVAARAGLDNPQARLITVGGTNGKGSTVAYIAELLQLLGYSTGVYTSPHFVHFNERIVIDGERVSAGELCDAFAHIDSVRGEISLTYFEFTTLAAMYCFNKRKVDLAVLEVGLGGRLDAVNSWDPEVACVTSVGIDHVEWLTDDREKIGFEKASIARAGRALVCGEPDPPESIARTAREIGATLLQVGADFDYNVNAAGWEYTDADGTVSLPLPAIPGNWAIGNAAVAFCATRQLLGERPPLALLESALSRVRVDGRMHSVVYRSVPVILDVAHNADASRQLAQYLGDEQIEGSTVAVFACMQDKDVDAIVEQLHNRIDRWYVADLGFPRAIDAADLTSLLHGRGVKSVDSFTSVTTAFAAAVAQSSTHDRVIVFGSFHVVGPVLALLAECP